MAPIPRPPLPRIVVYHQTVNDPEAKPISVLPLITHPGVSVTHIIVAAIHINEDPSAITLNDHHPSNPRFLTLWAELRIAQASGVAVLGMLGGAAKGSYARLDRDEATFELYYSPVRDLIREKGLDGLDLDVEEEMSLAGVIRLIDRLRADFGPDFIITLAPVAAALLDVKHNLSGFDYEALEVMRGKDIAWYNAQFYCGWGDASNPVMYEMCMAKGWRPEKVVMGLITTPKNGPGWVPWEILSTTLTFLKTQFVGFGGVMGWEYFNSSPGGTEKPWEWALHMTKLLRQVDAGTPGKESSAGAGHAVPPAATNTTTQPETDPDADTAAVPPVPGDFQYYSDGLADE